MSVRMFAAVRPPVAVADRLSDFLEPREDVIRWIDRQQWHLTLAFCAAVPERRVEDLIDGLTEVGRRHRPFTVGLGGSGAFPDPTRARVLWLDVPTGRDELTALATSSRNAASHAGAQPDGTNYVPHLSLARPRRPIEATKLLRLISSWPGAKWDVTEFDVIESHLGQAERGRPRYDTVATIGLLGP